MTLVKHGWGDNSPVYRQFFSQTFFSDVDSETIDRFNEFQRMTTSPKNAARSIDTFSEIDVRGHLGHINIPTLVLHSLDDQRIASSVGVSLAAAMPNAQLQFLLSRNHLPRLGKAAFEVMMHEVA